MNRAQHRKNTVIAKAWDREYEESLDGKTLSHIWYYRDWSRRIVLDIQDQIGEEDPSVVIMAIFEHAGESAFEDLAKACREFYLEENQEMCRDSLSLGMKWEDMVELLHIPTWIVTEQDFR